MSNNPVRHITIVGGGTAGWMAAAVLSEHFKAQDIKIQLIESTEIGTVGVGEATVPGILRLNNYLHILERDFISATQATFKLGIEFKDWYRPGTSFFHPFASYGAPIAGEDFYPCWLKLHKLGYDAPLEQFCLSLQMAKQQRFAQPDDNATHELAWYSYAYHFDAALYAAFLRQYAETRGVERIEGKIVDVHLNAENGFIAAVVMDNSQTIAGDLFIDCSGFRGLLIEQALQTGYEDWSHWLPCDSAVAVQTENHGDPAPYTCSTARSAGWQWKIPLQHRAGNGYVYCSQYIHDDEARAVLLQHVEGRCITQPRVLKFKTGVRKNFWTKNCVALGLASGFLEPLESTSISLIQTGIEKLIQFFPDMSFDPQPIAEANRLNQLEYERIRDFIILHYKSSQRDDSDFWRYLRNMPIPETLTQKIDAFRQDATLISYEQESFRDASWLSMYNGFCIEPNSYSSTVDRLDAKRLRETLDKMRSAIQSAIQYAPTHGEFLAQLQSLD